MNEPTKILVSLPKNARGLKTRQKARDLANLLTKREGDWITQGEVYCRAIELLEKDLRRRKRER